jgi:DNA-3-methyladenine glycosylase I
MLRHGENKGFLSYRTKPVYLVEELASCRSTVGLSYFRTKRSVVGLFVQWRQFCWNRDDGRILPHAGEDADSRRPVAVSVLSRYATHGISRGLPMKRCEWANRTEWEKLYHDSEWGVPMHDDRTLFEFLVLEGAQAGLSWSTILRKREGYRKAFDNFDVRKVSQYSENDVSRLLLNGEIIRNKLKITATVTNAQAFLQVQEQFGSFDQYIWQFANGRPRQNAWEKMSDIPSSTSESEAMSKDLKKRGFKFVGTTICYAFMQAVGMVNDHVVDCFRYEELRNRDQHDCVRGGPSGRKTGPPRRPDEHPRGYKDRK